MDLTPDIATWRVLVVDDEPDNLRLVCDLLEFSGASVARAEDGLQGLALVDSYAPNLILLDLGMPHLDGWELQRRLRAREEMAHVPIVALTALAMQADAARVRAAGFDAYITKPFRIKSLLEDLNACVAAFTAGTAATAAPSSPDITHSADVQDTANPANAAQTLRQENAKPNTSWSN